jgi:hypothetical protein
MSSAMKTTAPTVAPTTTPAGVVIDDEGGSPSPTACVKVDEEAGVLDVDVAF